MTTIVNPNRGGTASPQVLVSFEETIGITLPDEYKTFLLSTNGGKPSPDSYFVNDGEEEWESNVFFYGLQTGLYSLYSLQSNYKEYVNRIPAGLIPIGNDYCGNLICISIDHSNYGEIFFTHHDSFTYGREEPTDYGTYFLASSFTAFFDNLFESRS